MRLLFVIKALCLPGGGAERVLAEISSALVSRGHEVTVVTFDSARDTPFYPFDPSIRRVALGIGNVRADTGAGEMAQRMLALRRIARRSRPEAAIGFMHSSYIPLGLALLGSGIPVVASEHIAYDHYRSRRLQAALLRLTPWLVEAITVISPAIRDGFPQSLRRKMVVVPNPVAGRPGPMADAAGEQWPAKTLLAVGRLEEQKDHRTLVGAFARIASDHPDWRLRIIGEGSLREALEAQAALAGLGDRIALPGATANVAEEYAKAQLFAMPSTYESFGLTTAEALSHGLPVVGFADCPGTNELVKEGVNGVLARGKDREVALAMALDALMRDPQRRRRLGSAGPESIGAFAPSSVADLWEELLGRIAAARQ